LEAAFGSGRLTNDVGLSWFARMDAQLDVCDALAQHVPERRRGEVQHALLSLVRQRVYQITCSYEDQNDADDLRSDPLLPLM
jgi:RecB family exonuclease